MQSMKDCFVDLIVTSPPYSDLRSYNNTLQFDFKSIAKELFRILKDGGVIVWVVGDKTENGSESGDSFEQALYFKELGLNLHDTMIYEKHNFANPSSNRYHQIFEYMFVFSKGKPKTFNPIKDVKTKCYGMTNWGKNTIRRGDELVELPKKEYKTPYGMRRNIWKYCHGGNSSQDRKLSAGHPACIDSETEILTLSGWKNYKSLTKNDKICSYNIDNDCLEWDNICEIYQYNYNGNMIEARGRHIDMCVSPNHRCIYKSQRNLVKIKEARNLKSGDKIICSAKLKTEIDNNNFSNDEIEFLGWFLSEGNYRKYSKKDGTINVYGLEITQSETKNPKFVKEIENIIKRLNLNYTKILKNKKHSYNKEKNSDIATFYIKKQNNIEFVNKILSITDLDKNINKNFLSFNKEKMNIFLDTFRKGDGSKIRFSIGQKSINNLNFLQAIGCLLGYDAYMGKNYVNFNIKKYKNLRNSKESIIKEKKYNGIIWCPETEKNGTFLARKNGKVFITGNSFPIKLAEDHVKSWSNSGDLVFDPMCGGGTTLVAAKRLGRNYIGCDKVEEYTNIAKQRLDLIK